MRFFPRHPKLSPVFMRLMNPEQERDSSLHFVPLKITFSIG